MRSLPVISPRSAVPDTLPTRPAGFAVGGLPTLVDPKGRSYTYLRLSVTDRCDLGCIYCMPLSGEEDHGLRRDLLTFEEIVEVARVFAAMGVRRLRLTGGEPLVRRDVVHLVGLLGAVPGLESLVLTTNGTRLAELAGPLRAAGLREVNVSIDSLRPERFRAITRGGNVGDVVAGIHGALNAGLQVKINVVPLRDVNEDEWAELVEFAWRLGITPRFIELMPLGEGANVHGTHFVGTAEVRARLSHLLGDEAPVGRAGFGPARYVPSREGPHSVGFISALTGNFCDDCNRVRITARGDIRACLATRRAVSLRDVLRTGGDNRDVAWAIWWSLLGKDVGHHFLEPHVHEHEHVGMSLIGG